MPAHRSEMDIPPEIEVRDLALNPNSSATTVPALVMETLDAAIVQSRAVRETHIKTLKILDDWIEEGVAARNSIGSVSRRTYIAQRQLLPLLKARSDFGMRLMELNGAALELAMALGNDIGSEDGYPAEATVEGAKDKIVVKERERKLIAERLKRATEDAEPATQRVMKMLKKKKPAPEKWAGPLDLNTRNVSEDDGASEEVA